MSIKQLESLPATLADPEVGISHFAFSDRMIVGGCNFPNFEVFKKKFYSYAYYRDDNDAFYHVGDVDVPFAQAAFCSEADKLYVIGGLTEKDDKVVALNYAYYLVCDGSKLTKTYLADFPHNVHSAGACVHDGQLIVAGGVQDDVYSARCYSLYLSTGTWKEIASLPQCRQQPILVAHKTPILFSGFQGGADARVFTDVLALRDGAWYVHDDLPLSFAGGSAVVIGDRIALVGGVNELVFTTALRREHFTATGGPYVAEWLKTFGSKYIFYDREYFKFNQFLGLYNVEQKRFETRHLGMAVARAGCGLLRTAGGLIVVDGETQPRKRCRNIIKLQRTE